ncbi:unnamed protein product, partial [Polarella glacialis]
KAPGQLPDEETRVAEAWRFYRETLGSPRFVAAPMVGQSELPWRLMVRQSGCDLCYTPMLHAEEFEGSSEEEMVRQGFSSCPEDRPLIVQFCAKNPEDFLNAAKEVQDRCDAVDINLGCPQSKAMKGGWGGALMDEENWHVVFAIVRTAATSGLRVPVTCKMRIYADLQKTIRFAKMLEEAGCSLLTVHGRQRDRALQHAPANWSFIRAVREAVRIPVVANGGVSSRASAERCLRQTGCVAVMVATELLTDPELFAGPAREPCEPSLPSAEDEEADEDESQDDKMTATTADTTTPASLQDFRKSVRRSARQCLWYLDFCEVHHPWSIRWPRDHLRAILGPACGSVPRKGDPTNANILEAFNNVGADAGHSPPAVGAEEARAAYWKSLCQAFRDVVRTLCTRLELCEDGESSFEGLSWGSTACASAESTAAAPRPPTATVSNSLAAVKLAREIPISKRFLEAQQQKAAALKSCMLASSNRSRNGRQ